VSERHNFKAEERWEQLPLFPVRYGKTLEEIFGTPDFPYPDRAMPPGTYGGEPETDLGGVA
jgi:hypothetical protein